MATPVDHLKLRELGLKVSLSTDYGRLRAEMPVAVLELPVFCRSEAEMPVTEFNCQSSAAPAILLREGSALQGIETIRL